MSDGGPILKLWVVAGTDHYGVGVLGVYSTKEQAEQEQIKEEAKKGLSGWALFEVELDETQDTGE